MNGTITTSSDHIPPVASKPLILVVHGAWHVPEHYANLTAVLQEAGFPVLCPRLPSCNNAFPPTNNLDDDVLLVRSVPKSAISEGHQVVVLMHSYGGVVGSNALSGLGSKLKALVYMSAFIPMEGESLAAIFGGQLPPFLISNEDTSCIDIMDPGKMFYGDLPEDQQKKWAEMLVRHSIECQYEAVRRVDVKQDIGEKVAW